MAAIKSMIQGLASIGKCVLLSGHPSAPGKGKDRALVVMGNGPSLRGAIDEFGARLAEADTLAVNFAANSAEFFSLRPRYYVLADPHFFNMESGDANVVRLWENIFKADWEMTLWIPCARKKAFGEILKRDGVSRGKGLTVKYFNLTPGEGCGAICHRLYDKGLAMPRPRNVLIPSIIIGMREGYRRIVVIGADHSWMHTLSVDDRNRVLSVQPHFYKDNEKELDRVAQEYAGYHLHDILNSMTIAFRSYHQIEEYARKRGVEIINATPGSMIDAFKRGSLQNYL